MPLKCCCGCQCPQGDVEDVNEDFSSDPNWSQANSNASPYIRSGQLEFDLENVFSAYVHYYLHVCGDSGFDSITIEAEIDPDLGFARTAEKAGIFIHQAGVGVGPNPFHGYAISWENAKANFQTYKDLDGTPTDTGVAKADPFHPIIQIQRSSPTTYDITFSTDADGVIDTQLASEFFDTICWSIGIFATSTGSGVQYQPFTSADHFELVVT